MAMRSVTLRRGEGLCFTATSPEGHRVTLDTSPAIGGTGAGMRPTEALLMALGACGAMDVASMLRKMRTEPEAHEVLVEGTQREEHPRVFTSITVTHRIKGHVPEANVRRAITLSTTRYCPVHAMLAQAVAINDRYQLLRDGACIAAGVIDPLEEPGES